MPLISAALCVLPVLCFLTALFYLDSYQLVRPGLVLAVLGAGVAAALLSFLINRALLGTLPLERVFYARYVSPLIEEALKGAIVVVLIHRHRIGFLVDAAILGFAAGCGFSLAENVYLLWHAGDAGTATWIVRGFGTAIMHGGATAIVALVALAVTEREESHGLLGALPGFAAAVLLHSVFNHLAAVPRLATLAVLLAVPAMLLFAFHRSERALGDWLGHGFDADAQLLELIHSGGLSDAPAGRYLADLKSRFHGAIVADLICYLGLFTELALRAKGFAIMRENGFEPTLDDATRDKFTELRYLERSIGATGLLALHPLLPMRRRALSQLYALTA
ncbi:MAG TPA: PrsW family glutamic-type intramembrane protease [Burkholderiaceae bacterium]|nr:PrsW family glutamic-type intramembrane protease [Burkholderiaceae bacterium]